MTVIVKSPALSAGGYGEIAVVDPEYDYAFRSNEDRISGAPKSEHANDVMDAAQLGYKLGGWKSDTAIIDVRRDETAHCRAVISLYRDGELQLSMTCEADTLSAAIRQVERRLEV